MDNTEKCEASTSHYETVEQRLAVGTVIHIGGIPFKLEKETVVSGHPANFALAAESVIFPPSPSRLIGVKPAQPQEFGSALPQ
jgi:hypothetical protein